MPRVSPYCRKLASALIPIRRRTNTRACTLSTQAALLNFLQAVITATTRQVLWAKLPRCRKPIGLVLMDQSMMAGVGNIYRAEILFKAAVHPETPASAISREQFDKIW